MAITIYDLLGKKTYQQRIESQNESLFQLPTEQLGAGTYMIEAVAENQYFVQMFGKL